MQGVERQLNLLHLNPVAPAAAPPQPPGAKMGTPHKNSVPAGAQEGEEVRTLFVSGLPMDVRLRELYLLFRGYEREREGERRREGEKGEGKRGELGKGKRGEREKGRREGEGKKRGELGKGKRGEPIAFVSFKMRSQAERALEDLQGVRFDPASSQTLRLEFARTNSRVSPRQPPMATGSQGNSSTTHPSLPYQKNTSDTSCKNGSFIPVLPTNPPQQLSPHLYAPTDTWPQRIPMQVAYQSLSQLSSPSPTLSPASSFPQLSVLNMIESENSVNTRLHLMPTITPISAHPLQIMPAYSNCCPPILNDAYLVLINAIHF
ncbi:Protein couch potato [Geodia barretti]|uniref:Protein couch potato n=1 Tax=Geodia barretti TaxID=519541 RepID=A0AA35SPP7_GEOBA|nr:Protein couch potato [Geodia barretti]